MSASAHAQRQAEGIDGHRWRLHEASGVRLPCRILCECGWTSTAAQRSSALLQLKGQDILRSKGILAIDGAPKRYVYQGVHMMMDADWGQPWKADETRSSKLVFIGRNLDGENLKRGFEDCLK